MSNWMQPYGTSFDRDFFGRDWMMPFNSNFDRFGGFNNFDRFGGFNNFDRFGGFNNFDRFGGFNNWMTPFNNTFGSREMMPFGNFGGFGREFDRFGRDFDRMFKHFSSELNLQPSRPSSMFEHYSLTNPVRVDKEGNRWLNCSFDLRSYKPEEIHVTLDSKNRFLNVEAQHEVKEKEHYVKRHYARRVYIPEDVKVDLSKLELKSCLNNEGILNVEAPLPKLSLEEARSPVTKSMGTINPTVYNVPTKVM